MTERINDLDFLKLKVLYYRDGHKGELPQVTTGKERPGGANNREQNALRWGYDQAMRDVGDHIIHALLGKAASR